MMLVLNYVGRVIGGEELICIVIRIKGVMFILDIMNILDLVFV